MQGIKMKLKEVMNEIKYVKLDIIVLKEIKKVQGYRGREFR